MKNKLYTSITFTLLLLCSAVVMQAQDQSVKHQKPKLKLEAVEVVYPKEGKQVLIYPNPASSSITINTDEIDERPLVIEIYNDGGHRIYRQNWKEEALDISMLKPGIYFLKLKTSKETYTQKLIITR